MEKDLGRIKKNDFTDIVVRIDDFGGRPGITIREFVTGDRYTGFTKSGVKIQASDLPKFKEMINSVSEKDLEMSAEKSEKPSHKAPSKGQKTLSEEDSDMEESDEDEETEFEDY